MKTGHAWHAEALLAQMLSTATGLELRYCGQLCGDVRSQLAEREPYPRMGVVGRLSRHRVVQIRGFAPRTRVRSAIRAPQARGTYEDPPRAFTRALGLALKTSTVLIWSLALPFTHGIHRPAFRTIE
jgi:hypothetical protein